MAAGSAAGVINKETTRAVRVVESWAAAARSALFSATRMSAARSAERATRSFAALVDRLSTARAAPAAALLWSLGADVAEAVPSAVRAIASWSALAAVEPFVRTKVAAAPAGRASPRPTVRMLAPRRAAPRWRPAYWLRDTGMVLGNGNRAWDTVP